MVVISAGISNPHFGINVVLRPTFILRLVAQSILIKQGLVKNKISSIFPPHERQNTHDNYKPMTDTTPLTDTLPITDTTP